MRSFNSLVFLTIAGSLFACGEASHHDETDEGALGGTGSNFVLASASSPACVVSPTTDAPLDVKDCAGAGEFRIDEATHTIRLARDPNLCLDVRYEHKSAGASVIVHPCHGHANQSWRVSKALDEKSFLEPAVRIEAFANDGPSNLCLGTANGKLVLENCSSEDGRGWVLAQRAGDRLRQRGKIVTSLLTLGMLESTGEAEKPVADRSGKLPDQVGALAVDLVTRVMPRVANGESPRVLVVLDDAHHGENAEDAARIQQSLQELLTRTQARLEVEIRAGVEVTVTRIQAIIEDELSRMSIEIVEKRTVVRLLVATTLIVTTTKAQVELVNEPANGLTVEGLRMKDGKRPHTVWFSNPGHVIDDPSTIDSLLRFAQRGGGVVVQGDDAAQGTKALTGLELRGSGAEANGHIYCGQNYDNGAGKYPLASEQLSVASLVYTDDLDLANVVDGRAKVLATARPTCRGTTENLPAIVFIGADE